jgi:transposase
MATTAAHRRGFAPLFAHLDSTSFHVEGRDNRAEEPAAPVVHLTRGYRRDHRPDLNHVMLDVIVEHQAGIPLLMHPLSGHTSAAIDFRPVIPEHRAQRHTTYGTADLGADSALDNEANLQPLTQTRSQGMTRVPATVSEAQAALADADPAARTPVMEGYRAQVRTSPYGGVAQRWALISSEHRRPQAQRTVEKPLLQQPAAAVNAFQTVGRTVFACEADAPQARATFPPGVQATSLHAVTIRPTRRSAKPGRPGKATGPDAQGSHLAGALASSLAARDALVAHHRCVMLATHERNEGALSPQALLAGDTGHKPAARGFRVLKDPRFLASSLYLQKPPRMMARLMVMPVCLLVYAALE